MPSPTTRSGKMLTLLPKVADSAGRLTRRRATVDSGRLPIGSGPPSMNPRFVVSGCSIVGQAIPIGGVDIGAIEVLRRDEKLFSHFGEAGTAIFLIQEI